LVVKEENLNVTFPFKELKELANMSNSEKDQIIRLNNEAKTLMDAGKFAEARDLFVKIAEFYKKDKAFTYTATAYSKAGECSTNLKEFEKAVELFQKAVDSSFVVEPDSLLGIKALNDLRDSYNALGNEVKVEELNKKIKELRELREKADVSTGDDFNVFS
jgi:tetratricopeptide (TPR) repeat protein